MEKWTELRKEETQQHIKPSCKRHKGKPTFPPWMMFKANENNCFLQRAIKRSGKPSTPFNVYRFLIENQSALRKLLRLCCYLSQKLNLTWLRKLQEKVAFPNCQVAGSNTIQCFATHFFYSSCPHRRTYCPLRESKLYRDTTTVAVYKICRPAA